MNATQNTILKIVAICVAIYLLVQAFINPHIRLILFGPHEFMTWVSSIIWSIAGATVIKFRFLPKGLTWHEFSFKYWLDKNAIDFVKTIVLSLVILRLGGDGVVSVYESITDKKFPVKIDDFVAFSMVISAFAQNYFHKSTRKEVE